MPEPIADLDDLEEGRYYRYGADPDADDDVVFRVDRSADEPGEIYDSGCITFEYRDGYVSDLPVENVERYIEEERIYPHDD